MNVTRERMLAYLYGELSGEERDAFEAVVSASEADRRELAELEATLRQVRAGLQLDADPPPPARVRSNVLAAAEAQLAAAKAQAQPLAAAQTGGQSFWRWLRGAFIIPSLAMAAAAALLVFARREQLPTGATPVMPESGFEGEAVPSAPSPQPSAAQPAAASSPPPSAADPAPITPPTAAEALTTGKTRATQPKPQRTAAPSDATRFAQPPPDWTRERTASGAARPSAKSSASAEGSSFAQDEAMPTKADRRELAPAAEAVTQARARSAAAPALPKAEAAPVQPPSARGAAAAAEQPAAAPPAPPLAAPDLEKRAQNHEAAGRWGLASADYRELLKRFAGHPRASIWRSRLAITTHPPPTAAEPEGSSRPE